MCVQFGKESAETRDCENSAASVIHLRRIKKLDIPGLPDTDNTLLTVITEGNGKKRLYAFRVLYQEDSPEYKTLAVYEDLPNSGENPCVRENSEK